MDIQKKLEMEMRRFAVSKQMFDPRTGAVLDVRTAVIIENADESRVITVVSPETWIERGPTLLEKGHAITVKNAPKGSPRHGDPKGTNATAGQPESSDA